MTITASIGVAVSPRDGATSEALLKHVDIAMYRAKEQGRNCFELFASHMNVEGRIAFWHGVKVVE